jgi:putative SOS response-associated peptidase YedK
MCGRYTLFHEARELDRSFEVAISEVLREPRFNIAPTQEVPIVRRTSSGEREAALARWGLLPFWVKDPQAFKANLFNARAEGVADKPSFREPFKRRRCLVPTSGFYEWQKVADAKIPHLIRLRDGAPFALAGLYDRWEGADVVIESFTILTTRSNDLMASLHDRMPVILSPAAYDRWLDPAVQELEDLEELLQPYAAGEMEAYPVSRAVNSPRQDDPSLIERTE